MTPEQLALPGVVGNPMLGLAAAGAVTGGLALAGAGVIAAGAAQFGADVWASYTGGAALSAAYDQRFGTGQAFGTGIDQRFSYRGLGAAMTLDGLTGMYSTAMFGWTGVPNVFGNLGVKNSGNLIYFKI